MTIQNGKGKKVSLRLSQKSSRVMPSEMAVCEEEQTWTESTQQKQNLQWLLLICSAPCFEYSYFEFGIQVEITQFKYHFMTLLGKLLILGVCTKIQKDELRRNAPCYGKTATSILIIS